MSRPGHTKVVRTQGAIAEGSKLGEPAQKNSSTVRQNLNSSATKHGTLGTPIAQATRERVIGKLVDEEEAQLQLVQMFLAYRKGRKTIPPITIAAIKGLKRLIGIESLQTKEGLIYWQIEPGLGLRLERLGIDPESGVCVDREKFRVELKAMEQEKAARIEAKQGRADKEARREALRQSIRKYGWASTPKVASVEHYIENQVINTRIAKELLRGGKKQD